MRRQELKWQPREAADVTVLEDAGVLALFDAAGLWAGLWERCCGRGGRSCGRSPGSCRRCWPSIIERRAAGAEPNLVLALLIGFVTEPAALSAFAREIGCTGTVSMSEENSQTKPSEAALPRMASEVEKVADRPHART